MADGKFHIKLKPAFGSIGLIVEWVEKVEWVFDLCDIKRVETILPVRLTGLGGIFSVTQLIKEDRSDETRIKDALFTAFSAYEKFELFLGETVDVYLADFRKLALVFGGIPGVSVCLWTPYLRMTTYSTYLDDFLDRLT